MRLFNYQIKMRHDKGKETFVLLASDLAGVKQRIKNLYPHAPESAVLAIKRLYKSRTGKPDGVYKADFSKRTTYIPTKADIFAAAVSLFQASDNGKDTQGTDSVTFLALCLEIGESFDKWQHRHCNWDDYNGECYSHLLQRDFGRLCLYHCRDIQDITDKECLVIADFLNLPLKKGTK